MNCDIDIRFKSKPRPVWSSFKWCSPDVISQLKAAKLEIRDLQAEFELERNDYLATVRRLEREGHLLQALLERMAPLVRRDCNYSNLDRLRKEATWDEDGATWRLPEVVVQKMALPSGECRTGINYVVRISLKIGLMFTFLVDGLFV